MSARKAVAELGILAVRVGLGLLFLYSGYSKILQQAEFFNTLMGYRILPDWGARLVAFYLPWAEMVLGTAIVAGYRIRLAAGLAAGFLLLFMGVIASAMARGITLSDCGCFPGSGPPGPASLLRDAAFLAAALAVLRWDGGPLSLDGWRRSESGVKSFLNRLWQGLPLARKITLLVTGIVALALFLVGIFTSWAVASSIERTVGRHMLDLARIAAAMPEVRAGYASRDPTAALQPLSERIRAATGADLVIFLNMQGIRYSHWDPSHVGKAYTAGDEGRAMKGAAYVSRAACVGGPSVRGLAPVRAPDGRQVGVVVVGTFVNTMAEGARDIRTALLACFLLALVVGSAGAVLLAANIKGALRGLEPRAIGALLQEREAMLHSVREGIVAVDRQGRITLVNETASRLLNLSPSVIGRPVGEVIPNSRLPEVVRNGTPEYDQEQVIGEAVIITNRVPLLLDGEVVGAIATFRDKTEVSRLAEELTGVKGFVEALRAQNHEFQNKLQTIAGLIELESYEEAVDYIAATTRQRQHLVSTLLARVRDPAVAGLLVGKLSEAEERGISLSIDPASRLDPLPRHFDGNALVSVLGNLIQNAFEAVGAERSGGGRIEVSLREAGGEIVLSVENSGAPIPAHLLPRVFEKGWSTKGERRGLGLYLVKRQVEQAGGRVEVISEEGRGTRFAVRVPRRRPAAGQDYPAASSS